MRVIEVIKELWHFQCQLCDQVWQDVYEAVHADDGHGGDTVGWRRGGIAAMPPWADPACPSCLSLRVKPLPSAHRPALSIAEEVPAQRPMPG
jgi:hypothetical protein